MGDASNCYVLSEEQATAHPAHHKSAHTGGALLASDDTCGQMCTCDHVGPVTTHVAKCAHAITLVDIEDVQRETLGSIPGSNMSSSLFWRW